MLKKKIARKGLKIKWIAEQIHVNYSSLRVYLSNEDIMPEDIRKAVLKLIN